MTEPGEQTDLSIGVVDDSTLVRDLLGHRGTLRAHQHVIARAPDAATMISRLAELPNGRCDVILLDLRTDPSAGTLRLPGFSGRSDGLPESNPADVVQGVNAVELLQSSTAEMVRTGILHSQPAILIYTQEPAPFVHVKCLSAGAAASSARTTPSRRSPMRSIPWLPAASS